MEPLKWYCPKEKDGGRTDAAARKSAQPLILYGSFKIFNPPFVEPVNYRQALLKGDREPYIFGQRGIRRRNAPINIAFQFRVVGKTPFKIVFDFSVGFSSVKGFRIKATQSGHPAICQRNIEILLSRVTEYRGYLGIEGGK